jgi:uncharacterized membrane protein
MASTDPHKKNSNLLLRMHPLQRILLSLSVAVIVFLFIRSSHFGVLLTATILWIAFALSFIIISWIIFFKMPVYLIEERANKEDGSRQFVMISILLSSFASMFTVLLLMISKNDSGDHEIITIIVSISGMAASWVMVHTIFTFHYAHLYYFKEKDDTAGNNTLEFPKDNKPDYPDFAYFAFVIGMTFQVSDVQINSRITRRTALAHGLLSFALNTFVVALTINLIAGLKK